MSRPPALLSDHEWAIAYAAVAFLQKRLEQPETIEWALKLDTGNTVKRAAIQHLLDGPRGWQLREPWQLAWRLVEESWETPAERRRGGDGHYRILERVKNRDRSGGLIADIIDFVRIGIRVSGPRSDRKVRRPRRFEDILSVWPTSGEIVDPTKIGLNVIREKQFLTELALGLDAEVARGLDIANRLGWKIGHSLSRLGPVRRVYFVPESERRADEYEPDEFHRGIAPSVKLLYAVVSALKEIDLREAVNFVRHWEALQSPLHIRLWAAAARDTRIVTSADVSAFPRNCDDRQFWDLHYYPEIAELRASRLANLGATDQRAILLRLKKMPPRSHWPRGADAARLKEARLFWAARELRRVEIMGVELPDNLQAWLAGRLRESPELGRCRVRTRDSSECQKSALSRPTQIINTTCYRGHAVCTRLKWRFPHGAKDGTTTPRHALGIGFDRTGMRSNSSLISKLHQMVVPRIRKSGTILGQRYPSQLKEEGIDVRAQTRLRRSVRGACSPCSNNFRMRPYALRSRVLRSY
jgi:hypothetical protein